VGEVREHPQARRRRPAPARRVPSRTHAWLALTATTPPASASGVVAGDRSLPANGTAVAISPQGHHPPHRHSPPMLHRPPCCRLRLPRRPNRRLLPPRPHPSVSSGSSTETDPAPPTTSPRHSSVRRAKPSPITLGLPGVVAGAVICVETLRGVASTKPSRGRAHSVALDPRWTHDSTALRPLALSVVLLLYFRAAPPPPLGSEGNWANSTILNNTIRAMITTIPTTHNTTPP